MNLKTFTSAAALFIASAVIAGPAHAEDFTGLRVNAEIGLLADDFLGSNETSWGINAGYDVPLGAGGTVAEITGGYTDAFNDDFASRELSIGGRIGQKVSDNALVYGNASYSNLRALGFELDGAKVGAGLEFAFGSGAFVNVETRYANYEAGAELYQTVAGIGFRF